MPEIEIRFTSDQEYERLRHIRDKYGVQWRGMLIQGAKRLEGHPPGALPWSFDERHTAPGCTGRLAENDSTDTSVDTAGGRRRFSEPQ